MRPWEVKSAPIEKTSYAPKDYFEGFEKIFAAEPGYWCALGSRAPDVFQFEIDEQDRWFITLDDSGAQVQAGEHGAATVTWRSSRTAFSEAFAGHHHDEDPVRITGEIEPLQNLLRAISQF